MGWDNKSVYLGEKPGDVQYLTDVAPAFQYNSANYVECTSSNCKDIIIKRQRRNIVFAFLNADM